MNLNERMRKARAAHIPACSDDMTRDHVKRFAFAEVIEITWGIEPPDARPPKVAGDDIWCVGCQHGDHEWAYGSTLEDALRSFTIDEGQHAPACIWWRLDARSCDCCWLSDETRLEA